MRPLKGIFRQIVCALVLSVGVWASPAHAAPVDDASVYVEKLGNQAIETLTSKTLKKEAKRDAIEKLFRENVDIPWVGRFVLGRFWRPLTDEQKTRYLKQYETFLVRNYATRFTDYTSGSFKITGAHDDGDHEFTVSMTIQSGEAGSQPISVDYRVRMTDKGKKDFAVFDIIVEGVSMITTQRSEFSSVVSNKGVDYLITQIAAKSASTDADKPADAH